MEVTVLDVSAMRHRVMLRREAVCSSTEDSSEFVVEPSANVKQLAVALS